MSEMNEQMVQVAQHGGVAVVTLSEPQRRNPYSMAMREALLATCSRLMDEEDEVNIIVLTGAGANFCAGDDLDEMVSTSSMLALRERVSVGTRLARVLFTGPKPVIAAIEGSCIGGGLSLAALADFAFGSSEARFECPSLRMGLLPSTGLLWTLPQKVGMRKAREMIFRGTRMDGTQAARIGLLTECCAPGEALSKALAQAERLSKLPPVTLALLKGALVNGMNDPETAMRHETDINPLVRSTFDHKEAVAAFMEKRAPRFRGE